MKNHQVLLQKHFRNPTRISDNVLRPDESSVEETPNTYVWKISLISERYMCLDAVARHKGCSIQQLIDAAVDIVLGHRQATIV